MPAHRTITQLAAILGTVAVAAPAASAQAATAHHLSSHRKQRHAPPLIRSRHMAPVGLHAYTEQGR